jgi:hypothetical protein
MKSWLRAWKKASASRVALESGKRKRERRLRLEPLEVRALLSVRVWDGGGSDSNWTTVANWAGDTAPTAGDDLRFTGVVRTTAQNDFSAGTSFGSIEFTASNFSLAGNSLVITSGITVESGVSNSSIGFGINSGGSINFNVFGADLTVSGVVNGSGSLTKAGSGVLTLSPDYS